jgi:5-methyltetrahydrofolate--homocysteine methyltransferase
MASCERILETAVAENVDLIGLSGLITPSLDEMVHNAREMQRRGFQIPLLIGGATTSAKHTAVKIAPQYEQPTVHVLDASRCVGVVDRLLNRDARTTFASENRELQRQLVESFRQRKVELIPYDEARRRRFQTDWSTLPIDQPSFTGIRLLRDFPLAEVAPYIDWSPFFLAWELKGKYPALLNDPTVGPVARDLFQSAQQLLAELIGRKSLTANAVYGLWPAVSDGDDVVLFESAERGRPVARFPMLRQQWARKGQADFRSLADYVAPLESGRTDYVGAFALTAGIGAEALAACYAAQHDDYHSIMVKALADRLAEAFAELLHQRVRREWGYGTQERLTNEELIAARYRGIRPAPGYPACPDHSEKRTLFALLDAERNAGISLTETCAMLPAASVSGFYFAHPQARYFAVDRITRDQVVDYARRKGMAVGEVERWLAPNLGYDPA